MSYGQPHRLLHDVYINAGTAFTLFEFRVAVSSGAHWHDFYEVSLVLDGTGEHRLNGRVSHLERGSFFLVTPVDFHEVIPTPGEILHLYNAVFLKHFLRPEIAELLLQEGGAFAVELDESDTVRLAAEFKRMQEEVETPRPGGEWLAAGAMERVLMDAKRLYGFDRADPVAFVDPHVHPAVAKALSHMERHFREGMTLESVAAHVGLSANYFSEIFRKHAGFTFQENLLHLRLRFAHALLGMSRLPVTEICYASGFGSLPNFERAYKRKYGSTPRQTRESGSGKAAP